VRWSDGYFFLQSLSPPAVPVIDAVSDLLEATAVSDAEHLGEAESPPADDYDARLRAYRNIVARRGQPAFRAALLEAYGEKCAITGCDAAAALEAAHLRPYRGPESNKVSNGLPLRADIHTLLDLRLIAIEPATRAIAVSKALAEHSTSRSQIASSLTRPRTGSVQPGNPCLRLEGLYRLRGQSVRLLLSVNVA
jgi:hypothetical protein